MMMLALASISFEITERTKRDFCELNRTLLISI